MRRDNNLDYLAHVGIVFRWAVKQYEINRADLELMLYLHQFRFFTLQQFRDGTLMYSWDKSRLERLQREEWTKKIYVGNKKRGEHDKYTLTSKAIRMLRRIDRMLDDKEDMPLSIRNRVMTGKRYSDKVLKNAIIKKEKNGKT